MNINIVRQVEDMCARCENHPVCMGTGCEPKKALYILINKMVYNACDVCRHVDEISKEYALEEVNDASDALEERYCKKCFFETIYTEANNGT